MAKARRRVANKDVDTMMIQMLDKLWNEILSPYIFFPSSGAYEILSQSAS